MITNRKFNITEDKDKKTFLVHVEIDDELQPKDVVIRLAELKKSLDQVNKDIDAIPSIVEARHKTLMEQKKIIEEEVTMFDKVDNYARLWAKEEELTSQRATKE